MTLLLFLGNMRKSYRQKLLRILRRRTYRLLRMLFCCFLLSIQILAVEDAALAEALRQSRAAAAQKVLEKDAALAEKFNTK